MACWPCHCCHLLATSLIIQILPLSNWLLRHDVTIANKEVEPAFDFCDNSSHLLFCFWYVLFNFRICLLPLIILLENTPTTSDCECSSLHCELFCLVLAVLCETSYRYGGLSCKSAGFDWCGIQLRLFWPVLSSIPGKEKRVEKVEGKLDILLSTCQLLIDF